MRVYRGATGAGLCQACDPSKRERKVTIETYDDPPQIIEAQIAANLREIRRLRQFTGDVTWQSSLARSVR